MARPGRFSPRPPLDIRPEMSDRMQAGNPLPLAKVSSLMELNLQTVRVKGRASRPPTAELVRELGPSDLGLLSLEKGSANPEIVKLRESHHALARALAQGLRPGEAAALVGYTSSRVSILLATPAFQDLLAVYRQEVNEVFSDFTTKLKTLAVDAADLLHSRILDDPDSVKDSTLVDLMKAGADRTGYGPQTKTTNVNINVDLAERLEAARRRAGLKTIEGSAS